jgi:hypothetical protein
MEELYVNLKGKGNMRRQRQAKNKKYLFLLLTLVLAASILLFVKQYMLSKSEVTIETNVEPTKTKPPKIKEPAVVSPEQFGANGFDKKPDTKALQKAIDSGSSISLKSGATYIITQPLVSKHSIKIYTNGEKAAVISQKSKTNALVVENEPVISTYVSKMISSNQPYVVLKSTKGIKPGYLIQLKSSRLWYWDDRGYLTKGELHRVTKVEGNKVYLEAPTVEAYSVGKGEYVSAAVYPELSLQLENITFSHPKPSTTVMVKVNYTTNSKLTSVSVKNSKQIGIFLNSTFQTEVHDAHIDLGTTKDINTGYGIQDYGGSGTIIANSIFKRVRRGVDFSGSIPSRYGIVKDSKAFGYKTGTLASGNSGFGTHSTAEYITFQNNYIENFNYAFLVRGRNMTIMDNTLKGYSNSFIAISYGDQVKVLNNTYQRIGSSKLSSFILLSKMYDGTVEARGNVTDEMSGSFIKGDIDQLETLVLDENRILSK